MKPNNTEPSWAIPKVQQIVSELVLKLFYLFSPARRLPRHAKPPRVTVGSPETFVTLGREASFFESELRGRNGSPHRSFGDRRERCSTSSKRYEAPAVPFPSSELLLENVMLVVYTVRTAHHARVRGYPR